LFFKTTGDVFSWARANCDRLREINSSLEFKLHRLKFISMIKQGPTAQLAALYYSRNFEKFAEQHARGIIFITKIDDLVYMQNLSRQ
jgi:hypothetical protein